MHIGMPSKRAGMGLLKTSISNRPTAMPNAQLINIIKDIAANSKKLFIVFCIKVILSVKIGNPVTAKNGKPSMG